MKMAVFFCMKKSLKKRKHRIIMVFDFNFGLHVLYFFLSHDVAVIQWITSCYKNRMTTRHNNTLTRMRNVIDNVRVNNALPH